MGMAWGGRSAPMCMCVCVPFTRAESRRAQKAKGEGIPRTRRVHHGPRFTHILFHVLACLVLPLRYRRVPSPPDRVYHSFHDPPWKIWTGVSMATADANATPITWETLTRRIPTARTREKRTRQ